MNVLFAGNEDGDWFSLTGSYGSTGGSNFRAGYCRNALFLQQSALATATTPTFTPSSTVWMHEWAGLLVTATTNLQFMMYLLNGVVGTVAGLIGVCGTGTAGQLKIVKRSSANVVTVLATYSGSWPTTTLQQYDFYVNYGTSGRAIFYINGVAVMDSGVVDTTTDSATTLNQAAYSTPVPNNSNSSEFIVADSDTRASALWIMSTSTAGNSQAFVGTAGNVNKGSINDATFISAGSAGLIEEYQSPLVAGIPPGLWAVPAVVMTARANVGTSGPQHLQYATRIGSTDYLAASWAPPITVFANNSYVQNLNPATSAAWVTGDITVSSFNYGVASAA